MPTGFHQVTLVFGQTGQEVMFYPSQAELLYDGAPTSGATYQIWRGDEPLTNAAILSGSATLDAVATTVNAATGYSQTNRSRVFLASTASIVVGRRYLLTNAGGQREQVVVTGTSATYVDVEEPLAFDYTTADTFKGLRHVFTIDATFIADSSNINMFGSTPLQALNNDTSTQAPPYRIEWRYTTGSTARRSWTYFDVARVPAKALGLSLDDLRELLPDVQFHEWLAQRGQDFTPQLRAAERDLAIDIRTAGYDPDNVTDAQIYQRLLLQKWAVTIGKGLLFSRPEIGAWVDSVNNDYVKLFEKLIGSALRAWMSTSSSGEIAQEPARQPFLRR